MNIPKLIFIIPYRNRKPQKTHFDVYMKYILEDISTNDYEIYFAHQYDNRTFNRGAMKNIGFLAIKEKYPNNYKDITFVFNDVDTLPCTKNLFNYYTTRGVIKHFYGFKFALGGIFSITGYDFEKIDGFPNFWGWGLEDNVINQRALKNNIIIDRSNFYSIGNINIIHIIDNPVRMINDRESTEGTSIYGLKNISNLNYTFNNEYINIFNFKTEAELNKDEFYIKNISLPDGNKVLKNVLNPKKNINNFSKERWKLF